MNYNLTKYKFVEIKEKQGFIENNSGDILELAQTTKQPLLNSPNNVYIKPQNKYSYNLENGEKLYAKLVTRISGTINVFEGSIGSSPESIQASQIIFKDGKSLQDKYDDGSLAGDYNFKIENGHLILYKNQQI